MIKLVKNYNTRTIAIYKQGKDKEYRLVAIVDLDEVKELANNFDLDIQYCKNMEE
jgi:hypothetical protein